MGRIDLHTHTFASDGALLPAELARRAEALGHHAIAITDHAGPSNLADVLDRALAAAERLRGELDVRIVPGVELTHVPPSMIADLADEAKARGAAFVVVHGETIVEPVKTGTNRAAIEADAVDLLAHPGLLSAADADRAANTETYLEVSARRGHCLGNGLVVRRAQSAGAKLLCNTDAHAPSDLLTQQEAKEVVIGAGVEPDDVDTILVDNPQAILEGVS